MLEHQEELLNIAEISIGIAGFSGLVAAFLQRGGLGKLDRVRFVNLFANVTGWFWSSNFLAYLFGLFVYLYAACLLFVFLVLYRPATEE